MREIPRRQISQTFTRLDPFAHIYEDITKLRGEAYRDIFYKVRQIINHQFTKKVRHGIKGFLFWGEVGTGKTAMAKALAKDLGCPLIFVDGSDIARWRYGESEQQIVELLPDALGEKHIVLIDDAESVFPRRDWVKGESWHIAQNNVLFHRLDRMDTSCTVVIMTTNELSLMDKALRDRLYEVEFKSPPKEILIEITKDKCEELMIPWQELVSRLQADDKIKTIRDVEKAVLAYYAEEVR
ncbi:MAG: AAA family ATPase [Chloroflexota bacterium]